VFAGALLKCVENLTIGIVPCASEFAIPSPAGDRVHRWTIGHGHAAGRVVKVTTSRATSKDGKNATARVKPGTSCKWMSCGSRPRAGITLASTLAEQKSSALFSSE
jgi:hypothetical protein